MTRRHQQRAGFAPLRRLLATGGVAMALAAVAAPVPMLSSAAVAATMVSSNAGNNLSDFYAARGEGMLWFSNGQPRDAAHLLLQTLASSNVDGLMPHQFKVRALANALDEAQSGDPRAINRAETMLSNALVDYVRALRRPRDIGIYYVDPELRPVPQTPRAILTAAAAAPSLEEYITTMGWMHPLYGQLRAALAGGAAIDGAERSRLMLNLERARELPGGPGRHIVVNAAAQRLFVYDNGQVVDSMRVVVGKTQNPTPMMAANIRYAALNPYWNVPTDLAAERIAPNVLKKGVGYLKSMGYEVLADWTTDAAVLDPASVDWQGVADGAVEVRIRQLPGPRNSMGRMKFMFPNKNGVYLHDTPDKKLLGEETRLFSGGCVRLEDAQRLSGWLFKAPLKAAAASPEQKVELDRPVPVYITYLTAVPSGTQLAWYDDIYNRDSVRSAQLAAATAIAAAP